MGEYADMAVDQALNGNYWFPDDESDLEDSDWAPYSSRFRPRRKKRTNQQIFANFLSPTCPLGERENINEGTQGSNNG